MKHRNTFHFAPDKLNLCDQIHSTFRWLLEQCGIILLRLAVKFVNFVLCTCVCVPVFFFCFIHFKHCSCNCIVVHELLAHEIFQFSQILCTKMSKFGENSPHHPPVCTFICFNRSRARFRLPNEKCIASTKAYRTTTATETLSLGKTKIRTKQLEKTFAKYLKFPVCAAKEETSRKAEHLCF